MRLHLQKMHDIQATQMRLLFGCTFYYFRQRRDASALLFIIISMFTFPIVIVGRFSQRGFILEFFLLPCI
jgi:hypothetical protein